MKLFRTFTMLALASLLVSCASLDTGAGKTPKIKIAIAGPHTGLYAASGTELWTGAQQAAADINAAGGINGVPVEVIKGDDQCERERAIKLAKRLVRKKVNVVVGHFCSATSIGASEVYWPEDILMLSAASTNPTVTDRRLPTVMRISGRDDQQSHLASRHIVRNLRAKLAVVIHDGSFYGRSLTVGVQSALIKRGIRVSLYEGFERGETDFSRIVGKIRQINPDVVYFGGLAKDGGHLLRQLRDADINAWFFSASGLATGDFAGVVGNPQYLNKVLMTFDANALNPRENPAGVDVVKKFRATGYDPVGYTMNAYAAVQIVAKALEANNNNDSGEALANWLKRNPVQTALGSKAFDEKGDLTKSIYRIYRWNADGTYRQI